MSAPFVCFFFGMTTDTSVFLLENLSSQKAPFTKSDTNQATSFFLFHEKWFNGSEGLTKVSLQSVTWPQFWNFGKHHNEKNDPLGGDSLTTKDLFKVIFCLVPMVITIKRPFGRIICTFPSIKQANPRL